jgi:hypothetical protein
MKTGNAVVALFVLMLVIAIMVACCFVYAAQFTDDAKTNFIQTLLQ